MDEEENKEAEQEAAESEAKPVSAKRGGAGLAGFAILLSLAALGLGGWLIVEGQKEDPGLQSRLAELQKSVVAGQREMQGLGQQLQADLQRQLQGLQQQQQSFQQQQESLKQQQESLQQQQQARLESMQTSLRNQRQQLLELSSTDRSDWSLAEAEYLMRLAHQRLLMADDVSSALALLASVDGILQELDSADLHPARAAIAADLAALRAVPSLDVEGTWLRIRALAGEVDRLLLFELPDSTLTVPELPADADWQDRLQQGFSAALSRLANYLVIRRRDKPYEPLMDPQWERLVRQNMRMLLEQSQAALLSGNGELYRQSLASSRRWLGEFFSFNETAVLAMDAELQALGEINIERDYPDISASLQAVKSALNARHAAASGS